jgi:hypothetical protein
MVVPFFVAIFVRGIVLHDPYDPMAAADHPGSFAPGNLSYLPDTAHMLQS